MRRLAAVILVGVLIGGCTPVPEAAQIAHTVEPSAPPTSTLVLSADVRYFTPSFLSSFSTV